MFYGDFIAIITVVLTGTYEFNLFIMNPGDTLKRLARSLLFMAVLSLLFHVDADVP